MGVTDKTNAIARKAATGFETHQARSMTVQRALRLTIAKVAEDLHDLALAALSIGIDSVTNDALDDFIPDTDLLVFMEAAGRPVGLALLENALVGALVQQQTMMQVLPDFDSEYRMTRTDASLAAPLLDEFISRLENVIERPSDALTFKGFRFGDVAEDKRIALMALEGAEYRSFSMTLDVARGARQGKLVLLLPPPEEPVALPAPTEDGVMVAVDEEKPTMANTAMGLEAELNVVLCKVRMSLGTAQVLKPGDVLRVPDNTFPEVGLQTSTGSRIGAGVLGQLDGHRAVQVAHHVVQHNVPKRREADRDDLDLPDVLPLDDTPPNAHVDLSLPDLASPSEEVANLPALPDIHMPDLEFTEPEQDVSLPEIEPLPELDDLPDLADLPEFDGLPDLADLPELNSA